LVTTTFTTDSSTTALKAFIYNLSTTTSVSTFYVGAAWIEQKSISTPFPGDASTRSAGRIQASGTLLNSTQGWMAFRVKPQWASTAAPFTFPGLFEYVGTSPTRYVAAWFNGGNF